MPPRDERELSPIVYRDFTAGLYERGNDREVAPNGLLELQDAMPLPGGGLRAAWAWREESLTNLPTNRRVIGFQVDRGLRAQVLTGIIEAGLLLGSTSMVSTGPFTYEYWAARGTTALNDLFSWSSGPTHSSIKALYPSHFVYSGGSPVSTQFRWYYNVAASGDAPTQIGVFRLGALLFSSNSAQVFSSNTIYFASFQDRLVYVAGAEPPQDRFQRLRFTNPSTDSAPPSSNFLDVAKYVAGNIVYMHSVFPQDLFILKQSKGGFVVQGDLGGGPLVRELISSHAPERLSWGDRVPGGIAYMTETDGVWLWAGTEFAHLSQQFVGSPMTAPTLRSGTALDQPAPGFLGGLKYAGSWIFTPKGYIFDIERGWWFRSTLPTSNIYSQWSYDNIGNRIYAAGHTEPGDNLRIISASIDQSTMLRSPTFSATLPLIDTAERNVELRRIEVFGQGFGTGGTWQLQLTNDRGETETTDPAPVAARAASARFNTRLQGDWLKVRLLSEGATDASSETGKSEAPMVSQIIAWVRPRQTRLAS